MGRGIACAALALLLTFAGSASAAGRAYPLQVGNAYEFYRADGSEVDLGGRTWYSVRWLGDAEPGGEVFGYAAMEADAGRAAGKYETGAPSTYRYLLPDGTATEGAYLHLYRNGPAVVGMLRGGAGYVLLDPTTGDVLVDKHAYFERIGDTDRFLTKRKESDKVILLIDVHGDELAEIDGSWADGVGNEGWFRVVRGGTGKNGLDEAALYDDTGTRRTEYAPYVVYEPSAGIALCGTEGDMRAIDVAAAKLTGSGMGVPLPLAGHRDVFAACPGGLFIVRDGDAYGVIDRDGKQIIALAPGEIADVRGEGSDLFFVRNIDGRKVLYASDGTQMLPAQRDVDVVRHQPSFGAQTVIRCDDGASHRYITATGEDIDLHGAYATDELAPGVFLVRDETMPDATGAMDATGAWVLPPVYSYIECRYDLPRPYLEAWLGTYRRCFTLDGEPYQGMRYVARVAEDVYEVQHGLRYGLADAQGNWIAERSRFDRLID